MKDILERIKQLQELSGLSVNAFALKINMKQATLDMQFRGNRQLSLTTVVSVVNTFDDINANWLLTGRGSMHKSDDNTINIGYQKASSNSTINNAIGTCAHAHVSTSPDETTTSAEIEALREENARLQTEYKRIQDLNISLTEKLMKML